MNDFNVILNVGKALGMGSLLDAWQTPRDVFNLMKNVQKECHVILQVWTMMD